MRTSNYGELSFAESLLQGLASLSERDRQCQRRFYPHRAILAFCDWLEETNVEAPDRMAGMRGVVEVTLRRRSSLPC